MATTKTRTPDRESQLREQMEDRDHLKGCPADGRVEAYGATRPADPRRARPAHEVTVIRCVECGGSTVIEEPYLAFAGRLDHPDIEED